MSIGDTYRAAFNTRVNGVNCLNVFHFFQRDADSGEVPPDSLKAALQSIILPLWVPMLSNDAEVASVVLKKILPTVDQPYVYTFFGGTGTVAQEAEPPNLTVVASVYSSQLNRRGRGRFYLSGIAQTLIQQAVPKASFVSLFATFKTQLLTDFMDAGSGIHWGFVHYSKTNNAVYEVQHIEQRMQLRVLRGRIGNT